MRLTLAATTLACVLSGCVSVTPPSLPAVHATPPAMQGISDDLQFSQSVRVGQTVWVSGQVGYGAEGVPEGVAAQTRLAFENLALVLAESGASLADIVELTSYHVSMDDFGAFAAVKAEYVTAPFPAWTALEVAGLAEPSLLVEVKAVAVVGSGTAR